MKKMYLFCGALVALLSSCSTEQAVNDNSAGLSPLNVAVNISDKISTRSAVANFTAENIAVYVAGAGYSPIEVSNGKATTTTGVGTIDSLLPIINIGELVHVYGFYPSVAVVNPVATSTIPATVYAAQSFSATEQTDYMYATQDADVSNAEPDVVLTFHHALAKLSFVVQKTATYAGTGTLTQIKLSSPTDSTFLFLAATGTMAISSGTFAALTDTTDLTLAGSTAINEIGGIVVNAFALVAPLTPLSTGIILTMTIDGQIYTGTIAGTATSWDAGKDYTYTVTVSGKTLVVSAVNITDWSPTTGGTADTI